MAFTQRVTSQSASPANDGWKAQAFINIYLPRANGEGRHKIGALPLKEARQYDANLIKRLSEDPEALAKFKDALIIDFQLATDPSPEANALPF